MDFERKTEEFSHDILNSLFGKTLCDERISGTSYIAGYRHSSDVCQEIRRDFKCRVTDEFPTCMYCRIIAKVVNIRIAAERYPEETAEIVDTLRFLEAEGLFAALVDQMNEKLGRTSRLQ